MDDYQVTIVVIDWVLTLRTVRWALSFSVFLNIANVNLLLFQFVTISKEHVYAKLYELYF